MDLSKEIIIITAAQEDGLTDFGYDKTGKFTLVSGVTVFILKDLQFMLKFSIQVIQATDFFEEPGQVKNSTISHHLSKGLAEMGVGFFYITLPRLQYAIPLVASNIERFHAYYRPPTSIGYADVFTKPIPLPLASAFTAFLLAIGIIYSYAMSRENHNGYKRMLSLCGKICLEGVEWANATICQKVYQLKDFSQLAFYVRVLIFTGTMFTVFMYAYYSASILTFLMLQPQPFQAFKDLTNLDYTVSAIASVSSSLIADIQNNKESRLKYINVDLDRNSSIKQVFKGRHIHIDTIDVFWIGARSIGYSDQITCTMVSNLHMDGGDIKSGFFAKRGFKHREIFNSRTLKIMETGLVQRYWTHYYTKTVVKCPEIKKKYHDDLGMEELHTLFTAYAKCTLIALMFGIFEWFINFCKRKRQKNSNLVSRFSQLMK